MRKKTSKGFLVKATFHGTPSNEVAGWGLAKEYVQVGFCNYGRLHLCQPVSIGVKPNVMRLTPVTLQVTINFMIRNFKHKGLKRFFETGKTSGIQAQHAKKLRLILGRLHAARQPMDMNLPGLRLHELKGNRSGTWAVDVSGNWRITFRFEGEDVEVVDYEDYH